MEKVMIGTMSPQEASRLKSSLSTQGITVEIAVNHQTCRTGCSPTQEVWAHPADVPAIVGFLESARLQMLSQMGADPSRLDAVYDPSQPTATCPACGSQFSTSSSECPDCGLGFGIPGQTTKKGCC